MARRKKRGVRRLPSNVVLNQNILPQVYLNRSRFNISEGLKTTINVGDLVPVYWEEMNPGDQFNFNVNGLFRLTTPIVPIMDNLRVKLYSFFVPNRLLWSHWENFMGEQEKDGTTKDYIVPLINVGQAKEMSLSDYLGVPLNVGNAVTSLQVSALPYRAYLKIWNEWFRSEFLQKEHIFSDGDETVSITDKTDTNYKDYLLFNSLLKKGKNFDYFTSALPFPQVGEPVRIPLVGNSLVTTTADFGQPLGIRKGDSTYNFADNQAKTVLVNTEISKENNLYADMSGVSGATIEDLRNAFMIQRILEKDAQGGVRYIEQIRSHWHVVNPDYRLQRSHFLGSKSIPVTINPIAQTSATSQDSTPQANLSAVGVGGMRQHLFNYGATEHGILMVLACLDGDVSYQQGLPKKFSKKMRFDYMFPELANLGEQPILNKEIFAQGTAEDNKVFGYTERYRELKQGFSKITGKFRSTATQNLDIWHLAEKFNNLPTLSDEFIKVSLPLDRVLAVPDEPDLLCDFWFDISALRCLPVRANPGNMRL